MRPLCQLAVQARIGVAVLVAALLVGCSTSSPAKPQPSRTAGKSAHTGPVNTPPEQACHGGKPFWSESPPYAGPGPHPMIAFRPTGTDQPDSIPPDPPELPRRWAAAPGTSPELGVFLPMNEYRAYQRAQLALCVSEPRVTGRKIGTCSYADVNMPGTSGTPVDVVSAYYEFKVFEFSTGRLLKSFRLDGRPDICPAQVYFSSLKIAAGFDTGTLKARLRGLVESKATT